MRLYFKLPNVLMGVPTETLSVQRDAITITIGKANARAKHGLYY